MTPRQAQFVRESFEILRDMTAPLATLFYGRLFSRDPQLRALFHTDIREQGAKLMAMLAAVVNSADSLAAMRPQLRELGRRHREYGASEADYDAVASALLWALAQALEREFHPEVKEAWSALLAAVCEEMKRGAEEG